MGSDDLVATDTSKLRSASKQLKDSKSLGDDRITGKMLKVGGEALKRALVVLLSRCLEEGRIPESWQNAEVSS